MKQPDSNPLRKELARSQEAGAHPDSDVLSAFSENSLLAREREGVLAHLALCVQCREVLRIATEAAPELAAEAQLNAQPNAQPKPLARPMHPPLRSWLPWVAAAAGVLVVSSALLLHEPKKTVGEGSAAESARLTHGEATQAPAAAQLPSPSAPASPAKSAPRKTPSSGVRPETTRRPAEKSRDAAASAAMQAAAPPQEARAQAIPSQNQATNPSANATAGAMLSSAPRAPVSGPRAEAPAAVLKKYAAQQDQVESAKAAPAAAEGANIQEEAAQSGAAFSDAASNSAMRQAAGSNAVRPRWRINDLGQLERSFGYGAWQAVPMLDTSKLHVVSVYGNDVWAGGENLGLEHSGDNGATWEVVKLPAKNGYEHAITHIRFQSQQRGTIDSDDGIFWITTDGGRTWK